jgi:DNA polymerase-3 subunit delta
MKLNSREVAAYLASPPEKPGVVLLYGDDRFHVQELAERLVKHWLKGSDPRLHWRRLEMDQIKKDPEALAAAVDHRDLWGGHPVVTLQDVPGTIPPALKALLARDNLKTPVIVMASGNLTPQQSLRSTMERHASAVVLPCYADEPAALVSMIRQDCQESGLEISRAAMASLAEGWVGDRGAMRQGLELLRLYAGPECERLDDATVHRVVHGQRGCEYMDLAMAHHRQDRRMVCHYFRQLIRQQESLVSVLRALQNYYRRSAMVLGWHLGGMALSEAIGKLKPPVFFRYTRPYQEALQRSNPASMIRILGELIRLERAIKRHPEVAVERVEAWLIRSSPKSFKAT